MHQHAQTQPIDAVHIVLALVIAGAYLAVPFTALRRLAAYMPMTARVAGSFFFLTCAITHLALATDLHETNWMVLNDAVQAVSAITFITSLSRMVRVVMRRREARGNTAGGDDGQA